MLKDYIYNDYGFSETMEKVRSYIRELSKEFECPREALPFLDSLHHSCSGSKMTPRYADKMARKNLKVMASVALNYKERGVQKGVLMAFDKACDGVNPSRLKDGLNDLSKMIYAYQKVHSMHPVSPFLQELIGIVFQGNCRRRMPGVYEAQRSQRQQVALTEISRGER